MLANDYWRSCHSRNRICFYYLAAITERPSALGSRLSVKKTNVSLPSLVEEIINITNSRLRSLTVSKTECDRHFLLGANQIVTRIVNPRYNNSNQQRLKAALVFSPLIYISAFCHSLLANIGQFIVKYCVTPFIWWTWEDSSGNNVTVIVPHAPPTHRANFTDNIVKTYIWGKWPVSGQRTRIWLIFYLNKFFGQKIFFNAPWKLVNFFHKFFNIFIFKTPVEWKSNFALWLAHWILWKVSHLIGHIIWLTCLKNCHWARWCWWYRIVKLKRRFLNAILRGWFIN